METRLNIGTNQGNIQEVVINKPFNEIKYQDIYKKAKETFPTGKLLIHGWVRITEITKIEKELLNSFYTSLDYDFDDQTMYRDRMLLDFYKFVSFQGFCCQLSRNSNHE